VHRRLLRDPNWVSLTDSQRGQLVTIWLLAADHDGMIPDSPKLIQKLCYMDKPPDIETFIDQGFIEHDANVTPQRRQSDALEESRVDKIRGEESMGRKTSPTLTDEEFVQSLKSNPAYTGVDIDRELGRLDAWLLTPRGRGKRKTRRRIFNWLNNVEIEVKTPTREERLWNTKL